MCKEHFPRSCLPLSTIIIISFACSWAGFLKPYQSAFCFLASSITNLSSSFTHILLSFSLSFTIFPSCAMSFRFFRFFRRSRKTASASIRSKQPTDDITSKNSTNSSEASAYRYEGNRRYHNRDDVAYILPNDEEGIYLFIPSTFTFFSRQGSAYCSFNRPIHNCVSTQSPDIDYPYCRQHVYPSLY